MKFINPPEFMNKKDNDGNPVPLTYEVTNRALEPDNKDGVKLVLVAKEFEVPQAESQEDVNQLLGGADNFLDWFNKVLYNDALAAAKTKARVASTGSIEEIIEAAKLEAKSFNYIAPEKIDVKEAVNQISALRAQADNIQAMSADELRALMMKTLGIK